MSTTKNIFVAGAAGRLGQLVITQLLHAGHQVTALIRGADTKHAATAEDLRARGVLVVEGDVHTPSSYEAALRGIDSVVSTLQGGPDVIIDGQRQLLDAAVRAGVPHFIPSDFAIDYFGIPDGTHALLDLRRAFANYLHTQPITYTHVLNGAFMEMLSDANYGFIDFEDHSLAYWATGIRNWTSLRWKTRPRPWSWRYATSNTGTSPSKLPATKSTTTASKACSKS
jgi:uncharacterized protein YbjT (DUF2867 family)